MKESVLSFEENPSNHSFF